jgi:protease-4
MKLNEKICIIGVCFLMAAGNGMPLFAQNMFLELNLNSPAVQGVMRSVRPRPDLEKFRVIERAGKDKRISGIILNVSSYRESRETVWELRNALEKFKSTGKKVIVFISSADLDLYCLATVADKIVMDDLGILTLMGYSWGRPYLRRSLEKLGVGARELRYLEFKSASETFTRDSLSDADRRQYGEVLDDIAVLTRSAVTKARSLSEETYDSIINNEFMFSAKGAMERGLVDRAGRKEAVIEAAKEISGSSKNNFVLYGDEDSSLTESKFRYGPGKPGWFFPRPPIIAVINASGNTDMDRGIAARSLAQTIKEVSEKRRVKAIVLRISSPGGSAEAADYVAEAIKTAKQRLPVVVSMGDVAASGGYWISMTASHIIASPVTLTGSIGVIGTWFYDNGLNNKLGVTADFIQRGEHADLMSGFLLPHRDLSTAEEARYKDYILDMYAGFTAKVAENRKMEIERVEALAQGRVYSGLGALKAGLIDSIGGLDDAVRIARELAGIPEDKEVVYSEYPKPKFFDKMLDRLLVTAFVSGKAKNPANAPPLAETVAGFFIPAPPLAGPLLEDIRYRISNNGAAMPIVPLDCGW